MHMHMRMHMHMHMHMHVHMHVCMHAHCMCMYAAYKLVHIHCTCMCIACTPRAHCTYRWVSSSDRLATSAEGAEGAEGAAVFAYLLTERVGRTVVAIEGVHDYALPGVRAVYALHVHRMCTACGMCMCMCTACGMCMCMCTACGMCMCMCTACTLHVDASLQPGPCTLR
jgi:hypothetical protein